MRLFKPMMLSLAVVAGLSIQTPAMAQEGPSLQGILASAKIAGACGILDQMIDFQKKTQLEGGDKFVSRFWYAESARMGLSVQEMSEQCNQAIEFYQRAWDALGAEE
jgi:hypothetical protein